MAGALGKTVKDDDKDSSKEKIAVVPSVSGMRDEINETEWEDGSLPVLNSFNNSQEHIISGVTVELDVLPDAAKQKHIRRATAEEKVIITKLLQNLLFPAFANSKFSFFL